jgi:branched-chain amino acid transport system ATP-binding protein
VTDLLTVENLRVKYGSAEVCHGVDLSVPKGAVVLIIGSNGAGKTTILRTIAGLKRPSAGQVILRGLDITGWPGHRVVRTGVALVPEGRQVFPDHSVEENLTLGGFAHRGDRARTRVQMEEVFDLFPVLKERRRQHAGTLSGGEAQMLAIGRALMARPSLLMLDEPSLGLSPLLVQQIFRYVRRLNAEQGLTVLLVEQAAAAAIKIADFVFVLDAGRMALSGSAADVARDPKVQEVYFGAPRVQAAGRPDDDHFPATGTPDDGG